MLLPPLDCEVRWGNLEDWCNGSTTDFDSVRIGSSPVSLAMIRIERKEGWILNPNDRIVNGIFKAVERNGGECPCDNNSEDKHCPCSNYRLYDKCCCGLYLNTKD